MSDTISTLLEALQTNLGGSLPKIAGAVAILFGGWIVAVIVRFIVRRALRALGLNDRIAKGSGTTIDVERGGGTAAYYLILIIALIAFLNVLNLGLASAPLQALVNKVLGFVPNIVAALVLGLIAWILATVLRRITVVAVGSTKLQQKLDVDSEKTATLARSIGSVVYGLVILLFLPAILGALQFEGLLTPVRGLLDKTLGMLPNIAAAVIIGLVGWFVAGLLRTVVQNLLASVGADGLGERAGMRGTLTLSRLGGLAVFVVVLVPAIVAALNALQIDALTAPATQMLATVMNALPNLVAAAVIIGITLFVARFVASFVSGVLSGVGFDTLPDKLGVGGLFAESTPPSKVAGQIVIVVLTLFAIVEAANLLGFSQVADIAAVVITFGGQLLLALAVISVGLWIANAAHRALSRADRPAAALWANIVRLLILGLIIAIALRSIGIADDIVNLAFGLALGSVAVVIALAFGLGGREAAGKQMEHWLSNLRGEASGGKRRGR